MLKLLEDHKNHFVYSWPYGYATWCPINGDVVLRSNPEKCREVLVRNLFEYVVHSSGHTPYIKDLPDDKIRVALLCNNDFSLDLHSYVKFGQQLLNMFEQRAGLNKTKASFINTDQVAGALFEGDGRWFSSLMSISTYTYIISISEALIHNPEVTLEKLYNASTSGIDSPLFKQTQFEVVAPYLKLIADHFPELFETIALHEEMAQIPKFMCGCSDGIISLVNGSTEHTKTRKVFEKLLGYTEV